MIELLSALYVVLGSAAHANPSVYAQCTGDGYVIQVGIKPGTGATDPAEAVVDDGKGDPVAFEGAVPRGQLKRALAQGLGLTNKANAADHATLRIDGSAGTWTYARGEHRLACELN